MKGQPMSYEALKKQLEWYKNIVEKSGKSSQIESLERTLEFYKSQLEQAQKEIEKLKRQLNKHTSVVTDYAIENHRLKQEVQELRAELGKVMRQRGIARSASHWKCENCGYLNKK